MRKAANRGLKQAVVWRPSRMRESQVARPLNDLRATSPRPGGVGRAASFALTFWFALLVCVGMQIQGKK